MEKIYEIELEKECPFGKHQAEDLEILLETCRQNLENPSLDLIEKAFNFCVEAHKGVAPRASGDPYYTHPLKVSLSLLKEFNFADTATVVAALLHDTVEDVPWVSYEIVEKEFSQEVMEMVKSLTKIKGKLTRQMDKAATYGKLFLALVNDKRVLAIKLADRLDNMRTLNHLSPEKQKVIGHETLNFYTPIAQRLGLIKIKIDLEDLGLYFTDRKAYEGIRKKLKMKRMDFLAYIHNFHDQVQEKLNEKNLNHVITIQHKHIFEIYKMIEMGQELEEIDTFYSMVITLQTNDYSECYRAYGIIANLFGPVSTLDDYIARPKINFYRALHSTHFGPERKLVELIIRTEEMDKIAEGGIAALYSFKEGRKALRFDEAEVEDWINWMQDIIATGDKDAIQQIWGSIRKNLYEEEITVHTYSGKSYRLPKGACIIDLAYSISDDYGNHCISAKVNGEIPNLNYELKNNDKVDIITSPNSSPLPEWMDCVVTQRAVVTLYHHFSKKNKNDPKEKEEARSFDIKLRITGDDRPGILNEITKAIDKNNIHRINMYASSSNFEGVFSLSVANLDYLNHLFAKLLKIPGLKSVERVEEDD